jgi:serine/threonine-protein kinase PknG
VPKPGLSAQFTPERRHFRQRITATELPAVALALPVPQVDPTDPAAAFLAGTSSGDPAELVAALQAAPVVTAEVRLRLVRTRIEQGDLATARRELAELAAGSEADGLPPGDWRVTWYQGLAALAAGDPAAARTAFEAVYDELPGEAAPKLAIAVCAEAAGDTTVAARYYRVVWRTDHAWVSAAFGLARALLAQRDRARAVEVLHAVPDTSSQYQNARIAAIRARVAGQDRGDLTEADLVAASAEVDRLDVDEERRTRLSGELLDAAARWLAAGNAPRPTSRVAGRPLTERDVRFGLEGCYRALARLARTAGERIALVDQANAVRPRTLV